MSSRREFLAALGVGLVTGGPRLGIGRGVLSVQADPTVFYANPDGRRNLVRFYAGGIDAPAGRLRVFDARNRLMGTAGLLRHGDRLYGELWLALDEVTRVRSELEAPGVRGVFRTSHRLVPLPQWILRWMNFGDAERIERDLNAMGPYGRAARGAILIAAHTRAQPVDAFNSRFTGHFSWLRHPIAVLRSARAVGLEVSPVAVVERPNAVPWTALTLAQAAGVEAVLVPWSDAPNAARWLGPDQAPLEILRWTPGADSESLGLSGGRDMTLEVEQWLTSTLALLGATEGGNPSGEREALIVDTAPVAGLAQALTRVTDWNRRFAYPRILIGYERGERIGAPRPPATVEVARPTSVEASVPDVAALRSLADDRERVWAEQTAFCATILAHLPDAGTTSFPTAAPDVHRALDRLGAEIRSRFPGTVVWNPTPYRRSDFIELPDGAPRYVTNVPPLGYAFLVDTIGEERPLTPGTSNGLPLLQGDGIRALVNERSGAIGSLMDDDGGEWVGASSDGMNAIPGCRLERVEHLAAPPDSVRLRLHRWSPEYGDVTTMVTAHRGLPWIDIENDAAPLGTRRIDYYFGFDLPEALVRWELPIGWDEAPAPVGPVPHLRWMALHQPGRTAWLACAHTGYATAASDGLLVSHAPRGRVRYRIGAVRYSLTPAEMSRFGWSVVPLRWRPAPAKPDGRMPRDGAIVEHSDVEVAILGAVPVDDGDGVVLYLQNLSIEDRYVGVSAGLVGFDTATAVDLLERPVDGGVSPFSDGFVVHVRSRSIAAVRLGSTYLRGA